MQSSICLLGLPFSIFSLHAESSFFLNISFLNSNLTWLLQASTFRPRAGSVQLKRREEGLHGKLVTATDGYNIYAISGR